VYFEFDAETPANTTETSPVKTKMKLTAGVIHYVEFMFPAGCVGLAHARVKHFGAPLWPRNIDGNLKGDNLVIRFSEVYELKPGNNTLELYTWNEDDTYSHTVTCRIGLLRKEELFPEINLADMIRMFFRLFKRRS